MKGILAMWTKNNVPNVERVHLPFLQHLTLLWFLDEFVLLTQSLVFYIAFDTVFLFVSYIHLSLFFAMTLSVCFQCLSWNIHW